MSDLEQIQAIMVPLDQFIRDLAREAAREVARALVIEHALGCKIAEVAARMDLMEKRQNRFDVRFATFAGLLLGSGLVSGSAVGLVMKLL